jgi:hypothetical protein
VSVTPVDFTANYSLVRAQALTDFFVRALARDVKARYDTAHGLRDAWAAAFAATGPAETATGAPVDTPAARPAVPAASTQPAPGVYRSLAVLLDEFATAAGGRPSVTRRQIVEMVSGTHSNSPRDPFTTYPELAAAAQVSAGRVAQVFGEFAELWQKNPTLASTVDWLYRRLRAQLQESGGVSTPDLVAQAWAGGVLTTGGLDRPQRYALGVLRLVLASVIEADRTDAVAMVRRHGTGTVAMIADAGIARQLPGVLAEESDKLLAAAQRQGTSLVAPADAEQALRAAAARTLAVSSADLEVSTATLLRIGANASTEVALSARDEIHARSLPIGAALREVLQGMSVGDSFSRGELESRVTARFPTLAAPLPRRPELDRLVQDAVPGIGWDETRLRFLFAEGSGGISNLPSHHTRLPAPHPPSGAGSDVQRILRASALDGTYRGLGVPIGLSDAVADDLVVVFGATRIDVTEFVLRGLRELAEAEKLPWSEVLAADGGPAADRAALKDMVAQVIPDLVDAVNAGPGPVVLTDLSTLAAYGQLSVLHAWADLSGPARHAVWSLLPQPEEAGGGPGALVDGEAFPRTAPEQFVQLGVEDLAVLHGLAVEVAAGGAGVGVSVAQREGL